MTGIDTTISLKSEDYKHLPRTLRVVTDGAAVDIAVGHHDAEGRQVTRVDVMLDDETRGFGDGDCWVRDGARLVRLLPGETDLPGGRERAPLTPADVWDMAEGIAAVENGRLVTFQRETDDTSRRGRLRSLVRDADTDASLTTADDIRDALIRITLVGAGGDVFVPLMEVVALRRAGAFLIIAE